VFRSNPGVVFHGSGGFEAGGEDGFKEMKQFVSEQARICEGIERVHPCDMAGDRIHETSLNRANSESLVHPAVYYALIERATSNPSQSRRRGSHLAEHENIKVEVVPQASTLPPRMRA
jgi:hypothetical protein